MAKSATLHKPVHPGGTRAERKSVGRSLRTEIPINAHGSWSPGPDRPDPIALLQAEDEGRLERLLPIKYGRMLSSPFAFLRGSAAVMAADLAPHPSSRIQTQLCGDAHIDNFGLFATPERRLVFDLNDFDETLPGPWEWDLKRLAASAVVAGRELGYTDTTCRDIVSQAIQVYARIMREFSALSTLDVWYYHVEVERLEGLFTASTRKASASFQRTVKKARTKTQERSLARLTTVVDGQRRFKIEPPLLMPLLDLFGGIEADDPQALQQVVWKEYLASLSVERRRLLERFHVVDAAMRVGGIGSVGTRSAVALLEGGGVDDAIILQQKSAGASALEAHLRKNKFKTGAERVVHGQRLMQATSDIFLGWHRALRTDDVYYWRQLSDMKGSLDTAGLGKSGFALYVAICAGCLARAHGRAGDPALTSGYIGKGRALAEAIADFAVSYADQTEKDYQALQKAVKSGKVAAQTGV
jgi:uncharacterized protein (DUF2252 family)